MFIIGLFLKCIIDVSIIMKWYGNLYLGSGLEGKKENLIRKLESNAGLPGIYLVTLSANERDLFDVFAADVMLQPLMHGRCPLIIAMAKGKKAALDIALNLVKETYEKTGGFDVKTYLIQQIPPEKEAIVEYPMERFKPVKRRIFRKRS